MEINLINTRPANVNAIAESFGISKIDLTNKEVWINKVSVQYSSRFVSHELIEIQSTSTFPIKVKEDNDV